MDIGLSYIIPERSTRPARIHKLNGNIPKIVKVSMHTRFSAIVIDHPLDYGMCSQGNYSPGFTDEIILFIVSAS